MGMDDQEKVFGSVPEEMPYLEDPCQKRFQDGHIVMVSKESEEDRDLEVQELTDDQNIDGLPAKETTQCKDLPPLKNLQIP